MKKTYSNIYFVGAGGIGMAALVRYYLSKGCKVAGYDRTRTQLTDELVAEGAEITYNEDAEEIPAYCRDKENTLVVYTPAVPATHAGLQYFRNNGFDIMKRSQVLGLITHDSKGLCVAGTHGKTTTSSMIAHILHSSEVGCNAFLGGILRNYDSNFLLSETSPYSVIEADEFDRSFHWLNPYIAVVTATDPDHLDIYGTEEAYLESFAHFTELIQPGGALICHTGLKMRPRVQEGVTVYHYSRSEGDFHAENIRKGDGEILFDFVGIKGTIKDISLGVPVDINIENAVAALAVCQLENIDSETMKQAIASFQGPKRRFEFWMKEPGEHGKVVIDDYAHHPDELHALLTMARQLGYQRLVVAFQPHTYTRTAALFDDFVEVLRLPDRVVLAEIYAAREKNDIGISSRDLAARIPGAVYCATLEQTADELEKLAQPGDMIITVGAGDIYRAGELLLKRGDAQ